MARHVEDLNLLLAIIAGPDGKDPYTYPVSFGAPTRVDLTELKIAYYTDNGIVTPTQETILTINTVAQAIRKDVASISRVIPFSNCRCQ
jgi:amidase